MCNTLYDIIKPHFISLHSPFVTLPLERNYPPKFEVIFCVRGVISPLLANLYMRRFLLGWKQGGWDKKLQARIVNYADDFVILCRGTAEQARAAMEGMMGKLKLTVNQKKTRTCRVPEESFDFLGYTLGRCYQVGTGKAYIGAKPSKKRVMRLCDKISQMTQHKWCWRETEELVRELNLVLKGWGNYFQLGAVSKTYRALDIHTRYGYANGCAKSTRSRDVGAIDSRMSISTRSSVYSTWNASAQLCRGRKHKQPCPKAEMREIRTSGLMSRIWKRSLRATAPDLDSTIEKSCSPSRSWIPRRDTGRTN